METRNRIYFVIGVLFAIYAAPRVWGLTDSCLWFDEIFSVHAAEYSWGGMIWFVAQDFVHPPLFYALLKLWMGLGGESLLWLRLLPLFFSVLALAPFFLLCKELEIDRSSTILAAVFLSVNGSLIKYSQTLRMYTLLMLLSLLSIWLFARYFNRGKSWMWLVMVNILLIHTHYFGWLVVGAEVLTIVLFQRIKFARIALMTGIVAASFVPWLIAVLHPDRADLDVAQNIAWQARPGLKEMATFFFDLAGPFYVQLSNTDPASIYYVSVPIFLLGLIAIAMFLANEKSGNLTATFKWLSVFAIFPLAVAFLISWMTPHSVWGTRHLVIVTPILMIITAVSIVNLPDRPARLGITVLIVIFMTVGLYNHLRRATPNYVWCGWDGAAKEIVAGESTVPATPSIYAFEDLAAYHLWFALRKHDGASVGLIKGVEVATDNRAYFLPRGFDGVKTSRVDEISADEFWLVFRTFRLGEEFPLMENFTRMGYLICTPRQSRYDTDNLFRMKIVKESGRCPAPN